LNHHFLLVQSTLCLRNQNSYPSTQKPRQENGRGGLIHRLQGYFGKVGGIVAFLILFAVVARVMTRHS